MMGRKWETCAWSSYYTLGLNIYGSYAKQKAHSIYTYDVLSTIMQVNTPVFYKKQISSCTVHIDQLYIMYVCVWYENRNGK
jgi:hypothetical protein